MTPVLIHGFLGFRRLGPIEYFRGVPKTLAGVGITPLIPSLPATKSIAERATVLGRELLKIRSANLVLFGHSMGGLDARFLSANLDPDHRVKAVITIGTPHRGSPIAGATRSSRGILSRLERVLFGDALADLDPVVREIETIADRSDVRYISYAGARDPQDLPFLLRQKNYVFDGPNDGLVSVMSAQWGDFRGTVLADHLELVGWSLRKADPLRNRPFDHRSFWQKIVVEQISHRMGSGAE